jgi:L-threonylcarbamoyladenylate synthase
MQFVSSWPGARCPSHPVALDLLRRCGVPVAAPSANRFGHISPTSAAHVVGDLGQWPSGLLVLDGGETCDKGIESTIVRVVRPGGGSNAIVVEVVRQGALSVRELMAADLGAEVEFRIIRRETAMDAGVAETAPGQLITHYAPDVESFVLVPGCSGSGGGGGGEIIPEVQLASCVIVDFGGAQAALRSRAAAYEDISARGDPVEAAANLFAALRRAEIVEGARAVLLPDLRDDDRGSEAAVFDRIYRAASGKFACLDTEGLVRAAVDPRGGKV